MLKVYYRLLFTVGTVLNYTEYNYRSAYNPALCVQKYVRLDTGARSCIGNSCTTTYGVRVTRFAPILTVVRSRCRKGRRDKCFTVHVRVDAWSVSIYGEEHYSPRRSPVDARSLFLPHCC